MLNVSGVENPSLFPNTSRRCRAVQWSSVMAGMSGNHTDGKIMLYLSVGFPGSGLLAWEEVMTSCYFAL